MKEAGRARREEILADIAKVVCQDRCSSYDEPEDSFKDIAAGWNWLFRHKLRENFTPDDVAKAQVVLKLARLRNNPGHKDSCLDIAGYGVCLVDVIKAVKHEPEEDFIDGITVSKRT